MRKVASILLLAILFFNWFGYRLVTGYLENKANAALEEQLNSDQYDESQLISIKIPLTYLHYYNGTALYERINGSIEINGIHCNYVKRRLYNDSLEVLCIPNTALTKLQKEKFDFFKSTNDVQQRCPEKKSGSHPGNSKNFSIDYYLLHEGLCVNSLAIFHSKTSNYFSIQAVCRYSSFIEHPPENVD